MIQSIRATFQCDSCGREFSVAIDPAYLPPATWTLMEIAVDAVRQGVRYEGPPDNDGFGAPTVTPDGDQLCDVCSSKGDDDDE